MTPSEPAFSGSHHQSEPAFLREFHDRYVAERRAEGMAWIEEA
jgi:hypothetical protein